MKKFIDICNFLLDVILVDMIRMVWAFACIVAAMFIPMSKTKRDSFVFSFYKGCGAQVRPLFIRNAYHVKVAGLRFKVYNPNPFFDQYCRAAKKRNERENNPITNLTDKINKKIKVMQEAKAASA